MTRIPKDPNESYLHYYAKEVIVNWLSGSGGFYGPLRWNIHDCEIYEEYPLSASNGGSSHMPWDLYFHSYSCIPASDTRYWLPKTRLDGIPTRQELIDHEDPARYIVDVVIAGGSPEYYCTLIAIEIVHTSPTAPEKIAFLKESGFAVYEVSASDVMSSVTPCARPAGILTPCICAQVEPTGSMELEGGYKVQYKTYPDGKVTVIAVECQGSDVTAHFTAKDPAFTRVRFQDLRRVKNRMNMLC